MTDVVTDRTPLIIEGQQDETDPSTRVAVFIHGTDGTMLDASVHLFDTDAHDPNAIAISIIRAALAVAGMHGPDVAEALRVQLAKSPRPA